MQKYCQNGLTLVEIMVTITIIALLGLIALPDLSQLKRRQQGSTFITDFARIISLSRSSAVTQNTLVTLCKSSNGTSCGGRWEDQIIIFTDQNADRKINGDDQLLHQMHPAVKSGTVRFRSFQNKQYLQITPEGFTNYQNGNFTWCAENNDPALARQLIISRSGRTRMARDTDQDGIIEDSQGKPLSCP